VGGFDETLAWIRDIELGMRLRREGGVIVLDPSIQGKHLKRWTLTSMIWTDLFRRGVPWLRLILDGRADSATLNLTWRNRLGTGTSVVLVVGLARRNVRLVLTALAVLTVVDRDFYALLFRRGGLRMAAAGVPLHVVHRLTAVAAIPIALTGHVLDRSTRRRAAGDSLSLWRCASSRARVQPSAVANCATETRTPTVNPRAKPRRARAT
jgi:hypothetical protein